MMSLNNEKNKLNTYLMHLEVVLFVVADTQNISVYR